MASGYSWRTVSSRVVLKRVCVFCGSSPGANPRFADLARGLGHQLVERGIGLVYGGGNVGLMGVVADAVLERGGHVIGVIPHALMAREVGHRGLPDLRIVESMHERKALMADLADAFIALPGGIGTLEEFFEVLTWTQLGMHAKPCGLLNVDGFYDHLLAFLDHGVEQRFLRQEHRDMVLVETRPAALLDRFLLYQSPVTAKWIDRQST